MITYSVKIMYQPLTLGLEDGDHLRQTATLRRVTWRLNRPEEGQLEDKLMCRYAGCWQVF